MAATGQALLDLVKGNLGGRTDKDTRILSAVNNAIARLGSPAFCIWRNLVKVYSTTVPADSEYISLPTRTLSIISAWVHDSGGSDTMLDMCTSYQGDRINKSESSDRPVMVTPGWTGGNGNETGEPRLFGRSGNSIWLYPVPSESTSLYLRVVLRPNIALGLNDEHDMGEGLDHVIAAFATSEMYMHLNEDDKAGRWEGYAKRLANEARGVEEYEPGLTIKGSYDGVSGIGS